MKNKKTLKRNKKNITTSIKKWKSQISYYKKIYKLNKRKPIKKLKF